MSFYTFLPKLLNMSLTASVVIVLVLVARLLLKRAPKVISYALWGIVLVRLLCPVSIESGFSLFGLMDTPTSERSAHTSAIEYVPENIVHTEYPSIVLPVPGVGEAISETLPQGREQLVADPLEAPTSFATYIWMAGVLTMAIYAVVSYIRFRRTLVTVSPLRDNIYLADEITAPFVIGLIRPKIYLPSSLTEHEQSYILLHEQHHIRRLDHVFKALAFIALCIHWFNPLVWVAFVMAGKDMEMSCDEAVIRKLNPDVRADYASSLVSFATGKRIIAGMPLAFGEGNPKERVNNIARWKKPAFWVILVAVIACIVLAVSLLSNPVSKNDPASKNNLLEFSITSYLSDTQHIEIKELYNRETEAKSVTVNFETTEGPTTIELIYGQMKNGEGPEWSYSDPVPMMLGESVTVTVPADTHCIFSAAALEGANGNVTFTFIEGNVSQKATLKTNLTELIPGTTYVSYQCIYMNPLSSYAAFGGDSGYQYIVGDDFFAMVNRSGGAIEGAISIPNLDTADSTLVSNKIDVEKWEWQAFPYTDEEWAALYKPTISATKNISELHDEILYQPLTDMMFFLRVDGDLWLVELKDDARMGIYLWSIYSLVPETAMGVAQWEYAPMLSSRSPVFPFEFDMDYAEISAVCSGGQLVEFNFGDRATDSSLTFPAGKPLTWSPAGGEDWIGKDATIRFTVHGSDGQFYNGTLYIENSGGTNNGRTVYTASLVGAGLHLSPNLDSEGGVITAAGAADAAFSVNLSDNTSLAQKMSLTAATPYWSITVNNTGEKSIVMELEGDVYTIAGKTTETIRAKEAWAPGTYSVSFAGAGASKMYGAAICVLTESLTETIPNTSGSASVEHDLRTGALTISAEELDGYVFFTNSTKIAVTVQKDGAFSGDITLLDISQGNAEILYAHADQSDPECLFTGLTSARLYRIVCEGLDGCTLIIEDN